jgi:flagellar motor switch protein FliN/FliY
MNEAVRTVRIEFGRRAVDGAAAAALEPGNVVALEAAAEELVDVRVDGRVVARGKPVVIGGKLAVRVTEIIGPNGSGSENGKWTSCEDRKSVV